MKRMLGSIVFSFLILIFLCQPVVAKETDTIIIGKDEVVSSDLVKYGSSLLVSGKVDGDAYLIGGLVNFDGNVTGDLFVMGGKLNIGGQVGGSLRVAGGDVNINSKIGKNLTVLGGNTQIAKIAIPGSLLVAAGNLDDRAEVGLGGKMAVGRGYLDGSFGRDVKMVATDELILGPNFVANGLFNYGGNKEAKIDKNAKITGGITYDKNLKVMPGNLSYAFRQGNMTSVLKKVRLTTRGVSFLFTFIIGFLLIKLIPEKSRRFMELFEQKIITSFGWGLLSIVLSIVLIVFLCATIIGIPLALLYILIFIIMVFLAKIIGSLVLGRKLLNTLNLGERRGWALLIGLIIYYLISPLPVAGIIFRVLIITTSLGVFIVYYKNREALETLKTKKILVTRKKRNRRRDK